MPDRPPSGHADPSAMAHARSIIRAADIASDDQRRVQERILAFCDAHPDALYRTCLEGHLTGSALVVDPQAAEVLLVHHAKLGRWLQPGGHVDGEGDLAAAALREAEEETGLADLVVLEPAVDLDIHAIPERGDEPAHVHLDVRFVVLATGDTAATINEESLDARWVGLDDPDGLIGSAELRRLVERGLATMASLSPRRSVSRS